MDRKTMNYEMWAPVRTIKSALVTHEQGLNENEIDQILQRIRHSEYEACVASTDFDRALLNAVVRSNEFLSLRGAWGTVVFPESKLERYIADLLSNFQEGVAFPYRGALTLSLLLAEHAKGETLKAFLREMAHNYGIEFGPCVRIAARCLRRLNSKPVIIRKPLRKYDGIVNSVGQIGEATIQFYHFYRRISPNVLK